MITVYLARGERLELREAVAVRGEKFLGSGDAGVVFADAQGNALAQFRAAEIAGYVDDIERTRRQLERARERQAGDQPEQSADTTPAPQMSQNGHSSKVTAKSTSKTSTKTAA